MLFSPNCANAGLVACNIDIDKHIMHISVRIQGSFN
jgi:hypothetical protein